MTRLPDTIGKAAHFGPKFEGKPASAGAAEAGGAGRLESYANSSSLAKSKRARRHHRRAQLWKLSLLPRLRKCGKVRLTPHVEVRYSDGIGAGLAGLTTCGSVWACPVDSAKILAHRQDEVRAAVARHLEDGKPGRQIAMLTLTMRHRAGQPLATLWGALSTAWASVTSGRLWQVEKAAHGVVGWLRVVELTHGRNGWHVHVHALLFLDSETPATRATLTTWRKSIVGRWSRALERKDLSPALDRAQDFHLVEGDVEPLAGYFTKQTDDTVAESIALEFTHTASKTARAASGGRSPWSILDGGLAGDVDELRLWHEFEKASRGRRQLTWSRGLRDLLGLDDEQSDEEVAEAEAGDRQEALCQQVIQLFAFPATGYKTGNSPTVGRMTV